MTCLGTYLTWYLPMDYCLCRTYLQWREDGVLLGLPRSNSYS